MWRGLVRFYRAVKLSDVVLQLATGGVERISDGDMSILMPSGCGWVARDIYVPATGYGQVDANAVGVAFVVPVLRPGDDHARRRDAFVEALEPQRLLTYGSLKGIGMADVLEGDLKGHLHR
jgi:hypothetical protein